MKVSGCFGMTTYYEILDVSREAILEEIRAAYRRLAIKYYPNQDPGIRRRRNGLNRFPKLYRVLADKEKRQLYDLYGDAGLEGLELGGLTVEDIFSTFGDAFEDFFSFGLPGAKGSGPTRG